MIRNKVSYLASIVLILLIVMSVSSALAANIIVPTTHLTNQTIAITANSLKPTACSAITLTAILYCPTGGGLCSGTDASELVIGSNAADDIQSGKGSDCVVGGGGSDTIKAEQDIDVCIGGPGLDTFHQSCETEIQ